MKPGTKSARILAYIKARPHMRNLDVAKSLDVHPSLVSTIRQRAGLQKQGKRVPLALQSELSKDNSAFLSEQARASDCRVWDVLNGIVTDARLDQEETT